MRVAELFYSIQGEGARVGEPSIFVRLSGCDLACGFCDTEFESGVQVTNERLYAEIAKAVERAGATVQNGMWIVWTGGEPCLQLKAEDVEFFHRMGFRQAMETNGNHTPPSGLDWVCCSPKVAEHVLERNFPNGVDELRYVRHAGQPGIPKPKIKAKRLFLSPMFKGNVPDEENLKHCTKLCLENPQWSLSIQSHKILRML